MTRETRADIYSRITEEILAAINAGAGEWRMPWHHDGSSVTRPVNIISGKSYRGVNTLALWVAGHTRGFASGLWGTYRQWQSLGAQVRTGERATAIVFWKRLDGAEADGASDEHGTDCPRVIARGYQVFNRDQVEGYEPPVAAVLPASARIPHADAFIAALGIPVTFNADAAYYRIDLDRIFLPAFAAFHDAVSYIGTYLHEAAHAAGAAHRLDRDFGSRISKEALAMEELTAELTAAFVLADLGLAHHPRADHAAYVASWLKLLKNHPRAIFTAAGKAQAAADWMHARQSATSAPPS